ncbi:ISXO2-like transposase domain-containing protein [Belnapia rosea]|nr:ISXO2-like transposase domain-containing protein [Belnapia rosea]
MSCSSAARAKGVPIGTPAPTVRRVPLFEARARLTEVADDADPQLSGHATADRRGRSYVGKIALIGAVEIDEEGRPGRARLVVLPDYSAEKIGAFVRRTVAPKSGLLTDGLPVYKSLVRRYDHRPKVVGKMAAHVLMPWTHRVFSLLKRWGTGTFHGFRRPHLQAHLDEFAWRWSRRNSRHTSFDRLLGSLGALPHRDYRDFMPKMAA